MSCGYCFFFSSKVHFLSSSSLTVSILFYSDAEHEQQKKHELNNLWQKRQHEQFMTHGCVSRASVTFNGRQFAHFLSGAEQIFVFKMSPMFLLPISTI